MPTNTWDKLPLTLMDELAEKETYRRDVYRPVYSLHKWWARRPGSTFRMLGLAALTDDTVTKADILTERSSGSHDGLYITPDEDQIQTDATVLDPFAGGGTTLVELNRLGADVIGYELNPVAWWVEKKSTDEVNLDVLEREFDRILAETRAELGDLYTTVDPATGQECEVLYYFQSQRIPCLECGEDVQLFPRYQLAKTKKTMSGYLYCPNQACDDRVIELSDRSKGLDSGTTVTVDGETVTVTEDGNEVCPSCGHQFDPNDGTYGYGKYTCSNGHKHDVKETLQRRDERPTFERFALQYVDPQGTKRMKPFGDHDAACVADARERLAAVRAKLPIPDQEIPVGDKTQALLNYNYDQFSELFTERHLLTFGTLLQKATAVADQTFEDADAQNISEFLVTVVSNNLEYNGKLVKWHYGQSKSGHVFERHAFIPRVQPIEGNPLNHQSNSNSLRNFFDKLHDGKQFCEEPFEKVKNYETGEVEQFHVPDETVAEERVAGLHCQTAERLDQPDESVDYVITDPPYYDNVQYSELSDYFYVWLREALADDYDQFAPELVPKAREIVANSSANKDESFFVESLSNVFSECHRVLREDGEMVFTYHHNENEAWSVILAALVDSGFTITGAYPVQSEMPNNPHISELDNAEYDILIYANKEQVDERTTLTELKRDLFFELQEMAREERARHEGLSKADLGVILRGKCLYYYSRHYPEVYDDGERAGIDDALATVDEIIEQVLEGSVDLPNSIDTISEAYAAFVARGPESYDELNKQLLSKNLGLDDFADERLVKDADGQKVPVPADERVHHVERKLNDNGDDRRLAGDELLDVDKVHYLYHRYVTDQNTAEFLREWRSDDLTDLAEFLADATGDERYENVMEMSLEQF
jgi:adenine-specific DNA methylase